MSTTGMHWTWRYKGYVTGTREEPRRQILAGPINSELVRITGLMLAEYRERLALIRRARKGNAKARMELLQRFGCLVWTVEECKAEEQKRRLTMDHGRSSMVDRRAGGAP